MKRFATLIACTLLGAALIACGGAEERKAHHLERAQEHVERGELEKARVQYRNALQIDPRDVAVHMAAAQVAERLEDWRKAAAHYQRILTLEPEHLDAKVGLGKLYLLGNVPDQAAELAEAVLAVAPGHVDALVLRASLRAAAGDSEGAHKDVEAALDAAPTQPNAVALAATMDAEHGRLKEAATLIGRALATHPQHAGLASLHARVLLAQGDGKTAVEALEHIVAVQPRSLKSRRHLARVYASLGREDDGEQVLRDALEYEVEARDAKLALVGYALEHGGLSRAESIMREFIAADDRDALPLRSELARLYERAGLTEPARREYQAVIEEAEPESPAALEGRVGMARLIAREGRLDEALTQAQQVLEVNPRDRSALTLRATIALMRNDPAGAIVDLRVVVRDHEDALQELRLKARAHALNNEPEQALVDLRRIVRATPEDVRARLDLVEMTQRVGAGGNAEWAAALAEADRMLQRRLARAPEDAILHRLAGRVALARGDHQEARRHLAVAVKKRPDDAQARTLLAQALAGDQDLEAAVAEARRAVDLAPDDATARAQLALVLVRQDQPRKAEAALREGLVTEPGSLTLLEALARVQAGIQDWAALSGTAAQLKQSHPAHSNGWYYAGLAARGKGDAAAGAREFRRAVEHSPHAVEPAIALARSLLETGAPEDARERLARILERAPNDAGALNLMGEVLIALDRPQEAQEVLARVLELKPDWVDPLRNLALARARSGDVSGAEETLRGGDSGIAKPPAQVAYELATLYERLGKSGLAIAQYEALLQSEPGSTVAANNLAMLLASYRDDSESLQRALDLATPLAESGRAEFLDTLGWVQLRAGREREALETLGRAASFAPRDPVIRYHLGMAYLAAGRVDDARTELEGALAAGFGFQGWRDARAALDRISGS